MSAAGRSMCARREADDRVVETAPINEKRAWNA
jgi:hypothetical protein